MFLTKLRAAREKCRKGKRKIHQEIERRSAWRKALNPYNPANKVVDFYLNNCL